MKIQIASVSAYAQYSQSFYKTIKYTILLLVCVFILTQHYLNQTRAGLLPTTAVSQADVRTAIAKERRVELAFENHRWLDLVRTGQAISVMTAFGVKIKQQEPYLPADAYTDITEKRLIFPLPLEEVQTNKLLQQNPGY